MHSLTAGLERDCHMQGRTLESDRPLGTSSGIDTSVFGSLTLRPLGIVVCMKATAEPVDCVALTCHNLVSHLTKASRWNMAPAAVLLGER